MEITNAQRAEVLIKALPYIQKYTNKIVVVKYGGNAMINEELKAAVMGDIVLLSLIGIKVVLVHGGGPEITQMLEKVGKKTEFVDGLRVTDEETVQAKQYKAQCCLGMAPLETSSNGRHYYQMYAKELMK